MVGSGSVVPRPQKYVAEFVFGSVVAEFVFVVVRPQMSVAEFVSGSVVAYPQKSVVGSGSVDARPQNLLPSLGAWFLTSRI